MSGFWISNDHSTQKQILKIFPTFFGFKARFDP
jgi:hypothetical protein